MSPIQALKALLNDRFTSEDGKEIRATALKGLTMPEIDDLRKLLPGKGMPDEIVELIRFSSGFKYDFFDEISFINADTFNLEAFFPNVVELAGDGTGNFWLLDIDYEGNWGPVYYACHEPAVIMKQAESLTDFIKQIHNWAKQGDDALFFQLCDEGVNKIRKLRNGGFISTQTAKSSNDPVLRDFAATLPPEYLVADLRNKPIGSGFAWGEYYSVKDKDIRCKDLPLWGLKPKQSQGFWSKLFRRK
ncbi:MAG: SMI1/KNR4 family protein [Pseudobacter sp.]|uniref:SMI1/KNR4 family protein n=1 Tax=Pseudobacter sp. TaxID=2045420 RepID=UPI003F7F8799